jgi:hypothetical protein
VETALLLALLAQVSQRVVVAAVVEIHRALVALAVVVREWILLRQIAVERILAAVAVVLGTVLRQVLAVAVL